MGDVSAKFDMKIPAFALAGALLGGAGMFYGVQARVNILEVRAADLKISDEKRQNQIDAIRAEAEASRHRMTQAVGELKEILIELRGSSRRLDEKFELLNKSGGK